MKFSGEFNVSIDLKGRVSIPATFRDALRQTYQAESLIVTRKGAGLVAYPPEVWEEVCAKVDEIQDNSLKETVWRARISPAQECNFNAQGRIQIPQSLRSSAGLEKDVVVIGMPGKIEIWNLQAHQEIIAKSEERLASDAQVLADLGL